MGQGLEIVPGASLFGPLATCGRAPQTGQAQHVAHGCRCRHPFQACRLFGCSSGNSAARAVECQIQQSNSVWHATFTYCNLADPCVCVRACVSVCASSDRLNSVHYQHQLSIALSATCGWIPLGAKRQIKCRCAMWGRVAMIMLQHKSRGPPVHNNAAARRGSACS